MLSSNLRLLNDDKETIEKTQNLGFRNYEEFPIWSNLGINETRWDHRDIRNNNLDENSSKKVKSCTIIY